MLSLQTAPSGLKFRRDRRERAEYARAGVTPARGERALPGLPLL